jgi:hypothetical protein
MSHDQASVNAIFDEDVTDLVTVSEQTIPGDRITAAIEKARDAFWQSIGEAFPEVTSGDMAPGMEMPLEWATNDVVLAWLWGNYGQPPSRTDDHDPSPPHPERDSCSEVCLLTPTA